MNRMPQVNELLQPVFTAVKSLGGSASIHRIDDKVAEILGLPIEILEVPQPGHSMTRFHYRLAWARTRLKKIGFLENLSRGVWAIPHDKQTAENIDGVSDDEEDSTEIAEDIELEASSEFAYESDLRSYLAKNLVVFSPDLKLYEADGRSGVQFPVGGRFIDILAVDSNSDFVVIELKVSRGYEQVVGQLLRYMGWVRRNLAKAEQKVRGVIVAAEIKEDLLLACSLLPEVELFSYELSFKLNRLDKSCEQ